MPDVFLTHDMIAERALYDLQNELTFSNHAYRGYNNQFNSAVGGYKKGSSVTIQLPNKFRAKTGAAIDLVDIQESETSVTVDQHKHVAWDFLELDLTLSIEKFSERYVRPATIALANVVDYDGCGEYVNLYNLVGTPGITPTKFAELANAALRLDNSAVPRTDRVSVISPKAHWGLADGELKGVFNSQIVDTMLRKGFIGNFALTDFFMDQNIRAHTVGTWDAGSTGVMNGATAEGATQLVTNGWAASTVILQKGDVFTIAGVYGVNPISGQVWEGNELKQFVATAQVTSTGAGAATIPISPKIYSSAATEDFLPYQSVGTLPQNGAALTVVGTDAQNYPNNMIFHPDCFALTMVPFAKPKSAGQSVMWSQASDPKLGLSITVSTAFDISAYKEITRLDILYGWDTIRPDFGVRLAG